MKFIHLITTALFFISLHWLNAAENGIKEAQEKIVQAATDARKRVQESLLVKHAKKLDALKQQLADTEKDRCAKKFELSALELEHNRRIEELTQIYNTKKENIEKRIGVIKDTYTAIQAKIEEKEELIRAITDSEWTEIKPDNHSIGNGAKSGPDTYSYIPAELRPALHSVASASSIIRQITGF